jgi:hypothetical protein
MTARPDGTPVAVAVGERFGGVRRQPVRIKIIA